MDPFFFPIAITSWAFSSFYRNLRIKSKWSSMSTQILQIFKNKSYKSHKILPSVYTFFFKTLYRVKREKLVFDGRFFFALYKFSLNIISFLLFHKTDTQCNSIDRCDTPFVLWKHEENFIVERIVKENSFGLRFSIM